MHTTLIKNVSAVTPGAVVETSVLIEGTKIADIDPAASADADTIVDAKGRFLLPGVVDDQVHFREPGLTDKEDLRHATRACARGGVTSFLEMPNTSPATTTQDALESKLALASRKSLVNYGFYIGATEHNIDQLKIARRTPGIKIFVGSSTGNLLVDDQSVLERIFAETTLPIAAHCEDESTVQANSARFAGSTEVSTHSKVRDHQAASIATCRMIDLAVRHQHRFHVLHVSTGDEVPLIAAAGPWVTAEVCPHHLFFNTNDYERLGALVKVNPSIKRQDDNERLWQGLLDGQIHVIATDHAPHTLQEKQLPYPDCPSGLPSIENSLALMLNQVNAGRCSIENVVAWMCDHPARVWDLVDKGRIEVGYDADLTLVDMELEQTIANDAQLTKSRWSPWHGQSLRGWPVRTWVMGRQVFWLDDRRELRFDETVHGREIQFDHARNGFYRVL